MSEYDGRITIGVELDTKDVEKQLDGLSNGAVDDLKSALATAGKVGAAAIAGIGTAAVAATGMLVKGAGDVAAYGDNIDKMSQKMGMSAEAYQEWDAILQHSGTSIESLQMSMKTLASAAETGKDAFDALGLSQEHIAELSQEELFSETISALQQVEDDTERTYLAGQLLGRGATELGALLNTSAEETEAMRQRVHELGGVMSNEAVKAAARYQDSLQDMQTAFHGLSRGMLSDFLPSITSVMDGLTEIFSGNSEQGVSLISDGIRSLSAEIGKIIPQIAEVGGGILTALVDAITENLPVLLEAGANVVMQIADALIQNLPQLIEAGLQVVLSLATGIAESMPELIPTIVDVVLEIVDTLIENVDTLIDAAIAITLALASGMIDALPRLLEKVPEIVTKLVNAFVENAPKLLEAAVQLIVALAKGLVQSIPQLVKNIPQIVTAVIKGIVSGVAQMRDVGKQLIAGLWDGIKNMTKWLKDKVSNFFSGIVGSVKNLLGIHSPSRVFAGIGSYMMRGLAQGIAGSARLATGAMQSAIAAVEGAAALRLPSVSLPQIPRLATGAVIPANREFLAVLGDQRSGNNIEAPEALLRQMAQEAAGANTGLLREILAAIREGKVIAVDRTALGRTVQGATLDVRRMGY